MSGRRRDERNGEVPGNDWRKWHNAGGVDLPPHPRRDRHLPGSSEVEGERKGSALDQVLTQTNQHQVAASRFEHESRRRWNDENIRKQVHLAPAVAEPRLMDLDSLGHRSLSTGETVCLLTIVANCERDRHRAC